MKKYFKKFSIMFVMVLAVIGVGTIQNGIVAKAATLGQQLTSPEIGWQRYDDDNSNISYNNASTGTNAPNYGGKFKYTKTIGIFAKFNFTGTKIRIIDPENSMFSNNVTIKIDGILYHFSEYNSGLIFQSVVFDKQNLINREHSVEIIANDTNETDLDAVDIDSDGELLPYNEQIESISLDQSTMNLAVGDSQQLTATTTPAGAQVTWTSSDPSVATVDNDGNVTAVSEGQATITATTADGLTATCTVNVTPKDSEPTDPNGDANLYIELVDGQIKQYTVSSDEINKFTTWYENRDKDHSLSATYKFAKGTYTDYVVHDQIDWFEVR